MSVHTQPKHITDSNLWTSTLLVQAFQRLNVSIQLGSVITSAAVPLNSVVQSTFSGVVTLQRQLPGDASGIWRDVQGWTLVAAGALTAASENITVSPEPESVKYRLGVKSGDHYGVGSCNVRLGASGGKVE